MNQMEQIATFIVMNALMLPLFVIGIVLCCGRGADLIAGYNSASPGERARWNEKALCRGVGVLVLVMTGGVELSLLGALLDIPPLMWSSMALQVPAIVGGLLYINKSKRFKKD